MTWCICGTHYDVPVIIKHTNSLVAAFGTTTLDVVNCSEGLFYGDAVTIIIIGSADDRWIVHALKRL